MKKGLLWSLALLLSFILLLAACSSSESKDPEPVAVDPGTKNDSSSKPVEEASRLSAKGQFPITKDKTTLNILMVQHPAVLDYTDNAFTKYLEEKTNVQINWTLVPQSDWNTKLNLLLASGTNLPDVIMGGINNELISKYGSQGIFQPLNDLIDKHAVDFIEASSKVEGTMKMITAPDGSIYGLPKLSECYNCTMSRKMWVNKTFLDNVGLSVPTNTDEFYNMLKAFKEQDPNRNGKTDEIPLVGSITGWQQKIDMYLMSAFVLNDGGNRFVLENGNVSSAYTKPEWKQGLAYMKKLADEKLLDPVSFTQKQEQLKQLVENKDAMMVGAVASGGFHVFANANGERKKDYVAISPLKGPNGIQQSVWDPYSYIQPPSMFVLTSSCKGECADIAMKWADQFYNTDVTARSRLGVPDVDWKKAPAGSIGVNGKPAQFEAILPWGADQKSHWMFTNPGYWPRDWTEGPVFDPSNPWELQYALTKATTDLYEPYKASVVPPIFMNTAEAEEFSQLGAVINPYVEESIARFTLGNLSLEKDWESYLKELENMGLKRFLEIAQTAYDRQWKN